ncbi:tripeptidyl aminopeptidase [Acrasis kona]|uniref:Tripeptidyl aminopeptidase n=1 Tax=Acrasis kona TaxID=1008807 RepID=A0AAW2YMT9_9EUKA
MKTIAIATLALLIAFVNSQLTWFQCPLYTNKQVFVNETGHIVPSPQSEAASNFTIYSAQCAHFPVPQDYSIPTGPNLLVFVKKIAKNLSSKPALWFLQDGPGVSSTSFESTLDNLKQRFGDQFDFYYVEHRGVGRSKRLSCSGPQAETVGSDGGVAITLKEFPACADALTIEVGANPDRYSSESAARDLKSIIQTVKQQTNQKQFVYGFSYGTLLAARLMQLENADAVVDGLILDTVFSSSSSDSDPTLRTTMDQIDSRYEQAGRDFLLRCNETELCRTKITSDPYSYAQTVVAKIANGTCGAITDKYNMTASELRSILNTFLKDASLREVIPAVLYRLNRCDPDLDVLSIQKMLDYTRARNQAQEFIPDDSPMLLHHISLSELWSIPAPSVPYLEDQYNITAFSSGSAISIAQVRSITNWTTYTPSQAVFNKPLKTSKNVLLLNGGLDARLAYAQQVKSNIGDNSRLLVFDNSTGSILLSTVTNDPNEGLTCGAQIMMDFLLNNQDLANVKTACMSNLRPLGFSGNKDLNLELFGTEDAFEGFYDPPEVVKTVNLYLFIGVEAGTAVLAIIIICSLVYYIVQLKDKEAYENLDARQ